MATLAKTETENPTEIIESLARKGREAQRRLALMGDAEKAAALRAAAAALREDEATILEANAKDVAAGEANGLSGAMLDRLRLDSQRIDAMASGVEAVASLPDPVGEVINRSTPPNGLQLSNRLPI